MVPTVGTVDQVLDTGILVMFLGSGAFEQIGQRSFDFIRRREEWVLVSSTKVVDASKGRVTRRIGTLGPILGL